MLWLTLETEAITGFHGLYYMAPLTVYLLNTPVITGLNFHKRKNLRAGWSVKFSHLVTSNIILISEKHEKLVNNEIHLVALATRHNIEDTISNSVVAFNKLFVA